MENKEIRVLAKTNMTDFTKSNLVAMHLGLDSESVQGYIDPQGTVFVINNITTACEELMDIGEFLIAVADALNTDSDHISFI